MSLGLTLPARPCSSPGCRRLADPSCRGYCARHTRQDDRPSARDRGFTSRWDALAKDWLIRLPWCGQQHDGRFDATFSRCARHGRKVKAVCVNHRTSPRQGGSWFDPLNLESSCKSCNLHHAHVTGLMNMPTAPTTTANNDSETWG
jgi:hypothetical protein